MMSSLLSRLAPLFLALPAFAAELPPVGAVVTDAQQAKALVEDFHARPVQPWAAPTQADIPAGPEGDEIRRGLALVSDTSRLIGPHAADPGKRYSRNDLTCEGCHQAGPSGLPGTKPYALPWVNVVNDYPKFDAKAGKVLSLEMRIAGMLGAGHPPIALDAPEMKAMVAYMKFLSSKAKPGMAMAGVGLPEDLAMPARAADPKHGGELYAQKCVACHGAEGLGQPNADIEHGAGYAIPPIAGENSYDDGGHMYMIPLLTRFLYVNMPYGATAQAPQLSVDEAYDIAAYVDTELPRKHSANRKPLYPFADLRPAGFAIPENYPGDDAAYARARLGPFPP